MSNDTWQPGDLALCIKLGPWTRRYADGYTAEGNGPAPGSVHVVSAVGLTFHGLPSLKFAEHDLGPSHTGYRADRFRKVTPPPADEFDRETIDLMAGKPVPVSA